MGLDPGPLFIGKARLGSYGCYVPNVRACPGLYETI